VYRDWRRLCQKPENAHKGTLPYEVWLTYWQKPCIICRQDISTVGIDRWDAKLPYDAPGNAVPMCHVCNQGMGPFAKKEMLAHWAYVVQQHPYIAPKCFNEVEARKLCFRRRHNDGRPR
jgi:hypothetical protein